MHKLMMSSQKLFEKKKKKEKGKPKLFIPFSNKGEWKGGKGRKHGLTTIENADEPGWLITYISQKLKWPNPFKRSKAQSFPSSKSFPLKFDIL